MRVKKNLPFFPPTHVCSVIFFLLLLLLRTAPIFFDVGRLRISTFLLPSGLVEEKGKKITLIVVLRTSANTFVSVGVGERKKKGSEHPQTHTKKSDDRVRDCW